MWESNPQNLRSKRSTYASSVNGALLKLVPSAGIEPASPRLEVSYNFRYTTRAMFGAEYENRTRLTSLEDLDTTNMPTPHEFSDPVLPRANGSAHSRMLVINYHAACEAYHG